MVSRVFHNSNLNPTSFENFLYYLLAADQSRMMQEQMTMQAGGMSNQDPKAAFKAEWEALEVTEHHWALKNAEQELMKNVPPTQDNLYHQNQ